MAIDMKIVKFNGEPESYFRQRLLYSGLGKWIMQLFADRDFEDDDTNRVSKNHVTISAQNVVESFKKISQDARDYFIDIEGTIKTIEETYLNMGYINSGNYTFKYPTKRQKINMGPRSLIIDLDTDATRFYGLGLYGKNKETDISLEDFYVIKNNSLEYFKTLIKTLVFDRFESSFGIMEIYNIEQKRWLPFSEKYAKTHEYSILKIDKGDNYLVLRYTGETLYSAQIPYIYSFRENNDINVRHEIWRIILGLCAFNGYPANARISKYFDGGIKMDFGGFILPFQEQSILNCLAWPFNKSNNINCFVAAIEMIDKIISILEHLSIKVVKEGI